MKQRKAAIPFIMITVLLDMIVVGIILPVLPAWVGTFTHTPQANAVWYGTVVFGFGAANFFAAPVLGALSDCFGRRRILLFGIFGIMASLLLTSVASSLWMLLVARILGGAMQANLAVANAYVADITPPDLLTRRFGYLGAMMGIGFVLGPAVGGVLGHIDLRLPFSVAAVLASMNWLYGYFVLPESLDIGRRRPVSWRGATVFSALEGIFSIGRTRALVLAIGVNSLAQIAFSVAWVLYTQYRYNWGPQESGLSMFAIGVTSLLVQGILVEVIGKKVATEKLALTGLLCATMAYLLFGLASAAWCVYLIMFVHAAGFVSATALQSMLVRESQDIGQGRVFGAITSITALAGMLAPILVSSALTLVAGRSGDDWFVGAPMFVCASIQIVALVLTLGFFSQRGKTSILT